MNRLNDFVEFYEDFLGPQTLTASPAGSDLWDIADTSAAGTPTYVVGGINGEATITLASTVEVENVCLFQSDALNYDIDKLLLAEFWIKQGQATIDATTSLAFGMGSARNDAPDSIAANAMFRLIGSNAVVVETDDGTNDNDDKATGQTLSNAYKRFQIDFSDISDVKFTIDGHAVARSVTFDMSNYSDGLQPFVQLQKTSDDNVDAVVIDAIRILSRR